MHTIDIYRGLSLLTTIKPDDTSSQIKRVMGENTLNVTLESSSYLEFKINDYCTVYGERYNLNKLPIVTKGSVYDFKYTLVMDGEINELAKVQFLFPNQINDLQEGEFTLMANAERFLQHIVDNMNRVQSGWLMGEFVASEAKNLSFSKESCHAALVRCAEAFDTEFSVIDKKIHLVKKIRDTGYTFEVGRGKGLYEITRSNLNESNVVTRLYAYGAEKNLPPDYFARRLCLPGGYNSCTISSLTAEWENPLAGEQKITFHWTPPGSTGIISLTIQYRLTGSGDPWSDGPDVPIIPPANIIFSDLLSYDFRFRTNGGPCNGTFSPEFTVNGASIVDPLFVLEPLPYLEKNVATYGIIEHTEIFDDIFPHRTGTVTSVNVSDFYKFFDTAIDFDVNDHLLPGLEAKIVFNSGQLAGYEFKVSNFNNGTKEFTILKNADEKILDIPSSALKPAIGDEYVLVDIRMPQKYVLDAELELKNKALALLDQLSQPQLSYQIVFDPVFLLIHGFTIKPGDLVWLVDDQFSISRNIRVVSVTRGIVEENDYRVELADVVTASTISLILNSQLDNERDVSGVIRQITNNSVLNNNVIGDLRFLTIKEYADNAAAVAAGLVIGTVYRTGDILKVVHA